MTTTQSKERAMHSPITVVLETAAQEFADATSKPPFIYELGADKARDVLEDVQRSPVTKPAVDIEDMTIDGGPHGQVSVRLIKPAGATGTLPVVLYIHGAGWVLGSPQTHDLLVRNLAVGAQAAVVFPHYRRAPEAQYPAQIEEAYATASWIVEGGTEHGLDASRLAIAGDSVGGNMTIAVTMMAKQRAGPAFAAQLLYYPVTDAGMDTGSYQEFANGYFLTAAGMAWFWDQYLPDKSRRAEVLASPIRATLDELSGLPPALVITGEADVLRDEGEAYATRLRAAGVPVTATRYGGIIHDFVMLHPLAGTHAARAATAQGAAFLHEALHNA
jgi:acetyl esterase/lipase